MWRPPEQAAELRLNGRNRRNRGGLPTKSTGFTLCVIFAGKADNTRREKGRQQVDYLINRFGHGHMEEPRKASDGDRRNFGEWR
jgi:hypothetical protein